MTNPKENKDMAAMESLRKEKADVGKTRRGLMMTALAALAAGAVWAADPAWPSDFDVNLEQHSAAVISANTTSAASGAFVGELTVSTMSSAVSQGLDSAFETRTYTLGFSSPIGLDTTRVGFLLFLR